MRRTPTEIKADTTARFGARLREVRIALSLTQSQLGKRVGTSRTNIGRLETGRGPCPMLDSVVRYADALGVPPSHLLCVLDPVAS